MLNTMMQNENTSFAKISISFLRSCSQHWYCIQHDEASGYTFYNRNKFKLNCCTLSPTLNDIENSITFTVRTGAFVTLGRTSQVLQRRGNFNRFLKEPHSIIETGKLVRLLRSINCLRREYSEGCWCWELGCCFGGLLDAGGISKKWTTFERGCYPFSYNVKLV